MIGFVVWSSKVSEGEGAGKELGKERKGKERKGKPAFVRPRARDHEYELVHRAQESRVQRASDWSVCKQAASESRGERNPWRRRTKRELKELSLRSTYLTAWKEGTERVSELLRPWVT